MAVESPAEVVIVGLNRLSLEAGLYARFLGYQVTLLGGEFSVEAMADDGEFNLASCTTPLGKKALEAQGLVLNESEVDGLDSLDQRYLKPLAKSDLLADCCVDQCKLVKAEMGESELPEDLDEDVEYDTRVFELTVQQDGSASSLELTADVLIDCRTSKETNAVDLVCNFDTSALPDREGNKNAHRLVTQVPDFYRLGSGGNSSQADSTFLSGTEDIRDLFRILGDSSQLDLYSN